MKARRSSMVLAMAAVVLFALTGCFQSADQIAKGRLGESADDFRDLLSEHFSAEMSVQEATDEFRRIGQEQGLILGDYPDDVVPSTIVNHVYGIERNGSVLDFGTALFAESEIGGGWTYDSARLFLCVRFSIADDGVTLADDECPERIRDTQPPGGHVTLADIGR